MTDAPPPLFCIGRPNKNRRQPEGAEVSRMSGRRFASGTCRLSPVLCELSLLQGLRAVAPAARSFARIDPGSLVMMPSTPNATSCAASAGSSIV